jgi:hypothetical protein
MRIRLLSSPLQSPRTRVRAWVAALLLLVVCASGTSGPWGARAEMRLVGFGSSSGHDDARSGQKASAAVAFSIAGDVAGLYPGKTLPLVLFVTNRQASAITVTSITTTVGNSSSVCTAKYLKVTHFGGHLHVGPKKTAKTSVKVTLLHSAPNGCQGAVFPFSYAGQASAP